MCTIPMLGQERVSVKRWDHSIPSVEDCYAVVVLASIGLSGDALAKLETFDRAVMNGVTCIRRIPHMVATQTRDRQHFESKSSGCQVVQHAERTE